MNDLLQNTETPHTQKVKGERFYITCNSPLDHFVMSRYKSLSFEISVSGLHHLQVVSEHPMRTGDFVLSLVGETQEPIAPKAVSPKCISYQVPRGKIKIKWK